MERLTDADMSNEGFAYLDAKHLRSPASQPGLHRFVGGSGNELHCRARTPSTWDALLEQGADLGTAPFGLEPQRILRLEKGHVIVSQDTDSESNLLEAAMPWIVKSDKPDFVGKWAVEQVAERGLKWMLVGFESPTGKMPVEGGQVVVAGKSSGRVTSVRKSVELGKVIGLAVVPVAMAVDGGRFDVQVDGQPVPMTVHLGAFFDPEGARLKA
jgi:sarcosine oxidase subunit alpha